MEESLEQLKQSAAILGLSYYENVKYEKELAIVLGGVNNARVRELNKDCERIRIEWIDAQKKVKAHKDYIDGN